MTEGLKLRLFQAMEEYRKEYGKEPEAEFTYNDEESITTIKFELKLPAKATSMEEFQKSIVKK